MECREFGKTGMKPSILGFGMMRMKKDAEGKFDEQWSIETCVRLSIGALPMWIPLTPMVKVNGSPVYAFWMATGKK